MREPGDFLARFGQVFVAPDRAFAAVDRRPATWWQPLLLVAILNGVALHLIYDPVVLPAQLEELTRRGVAGEELERATSFVESGAARALAYLVAVAGLPLAALVGSLVAHGGAAYLLGGTAGFGRTWAVICHAILVDVPETALKVPLMLAQGSAEVHFGPAVLLSREPDEARSFLFLLLSRIDVFTLWKLALVAIGLSVVQRLRRRPVIGLIFGMWALWSVGAAVLARVLGA